MVQKTFFSSQNWKKIYLRGTGFVGKGSMRQQLPKNTSWSIYMDCYAFHGLTFLMRNYI